MSPKEHNSQYTYHYWYWHDLIRWPLLAVFGTLSFLLFFIFNRTSVSGRQHIPHGVNVIYACRHQSLIDSFVVTIAAMHLIDFFRPWLLPWHTADRANYMRSWISKFWGWSMKILPIAPSRIDLPNLNRMVIVTKHSRLFVFPGGTRERPGHQVKPRGGIGHVAMKTGATIVPIWISGMDKILPIGHSWPRFGQQIRIVFGEPVDYQDLLEQTDHNDLRPTKMAIAHRVVNAIYALSEEPETNPPIREPQPLREAIG